MAANTSERLMRSYLEDVARDQQLELLEGMAHPDMIDEANLAFGGPQGRDGLIAHVRGFHRNIDQLQLEIKEIVGSRSRVMAWWSFSGIHAGPWLGIKPTKERFTANVFSFFALKDGLIERYRLWLQAELNPPVTFDSRTGELKTFQR
jgi:predicted ester cyclase